MDEQERERREIWVCDTISALCRSEYFDSKVSWADVLREAYNEAFESGAADERFYT